MRLHPLPVTCLAKFKGAGQSKYFFAQFLLLILSIQNVLSEKASLVLQAKQKKSMSQCILDIVLLYNRDKNFYVDKFFCLCIFFLFLHFTTYTCDTWQLNHTLWFWSQIMFACMGNRYVIISINVHSVFNFLSNDYDRARLNQSLGPYVLHGGFMNLLKYLIFWWAF